MKDCEDCRYYDLSVFDIPCDNCGGTDEYDNWEPKEIDKLELEKDDQVNQPAQEERVTYYWEYGVEVKEIIRFILEKTNPEPFDAFCIGTEIAYRLRAGLKDPEKLYEDLDKAMKIREWRK